MTYEEVKRDEAVRVYIAQAAASLKALGFTEHSFAHVTRVAEIAGDILEKLGYPARTVELAKLPDSCTISETWSTGGSTARPVR